MKQPYLIFDPDLIIEATNACNRVCPGCYAPNILVDGAGSADAVGVIQINDSTLRHAWPQENIKITAIRGGEPTLNPNICDILAVASKNSDRVYLETNGFWISKEQTKLTNAIKENGIIVKLSLDEMHGTNPDQAKFAINILQDLEITVAVAITETSEVTFTEVRRRLLPGFDGELFWQRKAVNESELTHPKVGVITPRGKFQATVTNKFRTKGSITKSAFLALAMIISIMEVSAHAEEKITIGLAANFSSMSDSTSNPYANYFRNAIEMAFDENRELLKSKGLDVTLKEFDYGDDKLKVIETANAAVQSNALAVIGYIYSSDALLAGPVFTKNKLLLLTPTATADRVEEIGPFVRRTCFNDSYQGKILADFAFKSQRVKNVAIVSVADCAYCQSLRGAFKERIEALGGKVVVDQTVLSSDDKFENVIAAIKGKTIDAIFIPNYERASATIISQLYDAGIKPKLWLGGDGWGNSVDLFYRIVGKRQFKAYTISHWHRDIKTSKSNAFLENFSKRYGKTPVDTAVLAYDAALLLIQGLATSKNKTREGILESIEKIRTFDGVTGRMVYPPSGRTPTKPAVLLKLDSGKLTVERIIGGI